LSGTEEVFPIWRGGTETEENKNRDRECEESDTGSVKELTERGKEKLTVVEAVRKGQKTKARREKEQR